MDIFILAIVGRFKMFFFRDHVSSNVLQFFLSREISNRDRTKSAQRKHKRSLKRADFYFLFLQKTSWHTLLQFGMGGCSAQRVSLLRSPKSSCLDLCRSPHIYSLMDSLEDKLPCLIRHDDVYICTDLSWGTYITYCPHAIFAVDKCTINILKE